MSTQATSPPQVVAGARRVLQHALARPATLGPARLVCVDGPSGSGKSVLAAAMVALRPGSVLVAGDDLLAGWDGLPGLDATWERLVRALATGGVGHYRRHDWHRDRPGEAVSVPLRPLVVAEGVGAGTPALDPWRTTLAWVEAPYALRLRRGLDRDGEAFAPHWRRWAVREAGLHVRQRTRGRADVRLDGRGREVS